MKPKERLLPSRFPESPPSESSAARGRLREWAHAGFAIALGCALSDELDAGHALRAGEVA